MKRAFNIILLAICLVFAATAQSAANQIEAGLVWLNSNQNSTGSWGNADGPVNNEYFTTVEALHVISDADQTDTLSYQNGTLWLQSQIVEYSPYLSLKIVLLANSGIDLSTDIDTLLSYRNSDGGWGGYLKYWSGNFHTALALEAMKAVNYADTTIISSTLGYLINTQNPDGGWGFDQGDESSVYMTANVLQSLLAYDGIFKIQDSKDRAIAYLLTKQNADGGFGMGGETPPLQTTTSTVYETALALISLINANTGQAQDLPLQQQIQNAINYLETTQLPNG